MKKEIKEHLRKMASNGGKKSAQNMTPEQRTERARKAIKTRWEKLSTEIKDEDLHTN